MSRDRDLDAAILGSLDDLLGALELEPADAGRFRVSSDTTPMFDRIYGGQLLAQAIVGAGATVDGKDVHSLHAAFVRAGVHGRPVDIAVDRVRDGRSMATRQVTVLQDDAPTLVAIASFHTNSDGPHVAGPAPEVQPPDETPRIQAWARQAGDGGRHWIDTPPPVDLRIAEAPSFLGGTSTTRRRTHWMRLPRDIGDDGLLHAALLAYASDFFLMDMVFRGHPDALGPGSAVSVDHAIWFHRPVRFDRWHAHTQQLITIHGSRGLTRGAIHDADGALVATVMQEVLVRPLVVT